MRSVQRQVENQVLDRVWRTKNHVSQVAWIQVLEKTHGMRAALSQAVHQVVSQVEENLR